MSSTFFRGVALMRPNRPAQLVSLALRDPDAAHEVGEAGVVADGVESGREGAHPDEVAFACGVGELQLGERLVAFA
jgi:hypothetical protein